MFTTHLARDTRSRGWQTLREEADQTMFQAHSLGHGGRGRSGWGGRGVNRDRHHETVSSRLDRRAATCASIARSASRARPPTPYGFIPQKYCGPGGAAAARALRGAEIRGGRRTRWTSDPHRESIGARQLLPSARGRRSGGCGYHARRRTTRSSAVLGAPWRTATCADIARSAPQGRPSSACGTTPHYKQIAGEAGGAGRLARGLRPCRGGSRCDPAQPRGLNARVSATRRTRRGAGRTADRQGG